MRRFKGDERFKTEDVFVEHFSKDVLPLREKIGRMNVRAIPDEELGRALFVFVNGNDMFTYYRKRASLSPYARAHLDGYVERQEV
jgi:hypothetical protein